MSDALSFLIDECLHASLVETANGLGYTAYHIEHLGLKGAPDWQLWKRALQDDLIFVTNNAQDNLQALNGSLVAVAGDSTAYLMSAVIYVLPARRPVNRDSRQEIPFHLVR